MKKVILTESQVNKLVEQIMAPQMLLNKVANSYANSPLHVYCALRFLKMSKETLTERELKKETLSTLSNVICEKANRMGSCNPDMWQGKDPKGLPNKNQLGYHDYTTLYSKSPSYKGTSFTYGSQPTNISELMLTLGGATIRQGGSGWVIYDMYNFDNIMEKKPHLKTNNYFKMYLNTLRGIGATIGGWLLGRSPVNGIEEVMSQLHNTGYKGFPVQINVPSNGCKCKSKI
jgi:hypothetical protein